LEVRWPRRQRLSKEVFYRFLDRMSMREDLLLR
jgi:hypothetical protein